MIRRLTILLLIVGCEKEPPSKWNATLSGTYSLTGYVMFDNSGCSGESIISPTVEEITLAQLDYTYEFDGNSVTIIQITSGVE